MYGSYVFPDWALSIGWALALCPCSLIPITMIVMFFYKAGSCAVSKVVFYARRDYVHPAVQQRLQYCMSALFCNVKLKEQYYCLVVCRC